jgi:tight adherence protein B
VSGTTLIAALGGACAGLALAELWVLSGADGATAPRERGARQQQQRRHRLPAVPRAAPLGFAAALVGWALLGPLGVIAGPATAIAAARAAGQRGRRRVARQCERGVGALARSLADAVRAGHSVRGALHGAATDRAVPIALRGAIQEIDAALLRGATLADALRRLGQDAGPQLLLLCAIVALHAERGGRLPQALDRLAEDADRAVRLDEERAAATAQARATVRTVAALPLLALAAAQLLGGNLLSAVGRTPISLALLVTGLALEVVAVVIAGRLVARAT